MCLPVLTPKIKKQKTYITHWIRAGIGPRHPFPSGKMAVRTLPSPPGRGRNNKNETKGVLNYAQLGMGRHMRGVSER